MVEDDTTESVNEATETTVVTAAELCAADVNALLGELKSVDWLDISRCLRKHLEHSDSDVAEPIGLLRDVIEYHLVPECEKCPFRPMVEGEGKRSGVPHDLSQGQLKELAAFARHICNAGLRARVADVVWFVVRARNDMADLAINSYCDCIDQVRNGESVFASGDASAWGVPATEILLRASRISHAPGKQQLSSRERLQELLLSLVNEVYAQRDAPGFVRMAEVAMADGGIKSEQILEKIDDLGGRPDLAPKVRIRLWETAISCCRSLKDQAREGDYAGKIATEFEVLADGAQSSIVAVDHLRRAVGALVNYKCTKSRRAELMDKILTVQSKIGDELTPVIKRVNVVEYQKAAVQTASGLDWQSALRTLICCDIVPTEEQVVKQTVAHCRKFPLQSVMAKDVIDSQGGLKFSVPGMTKDLDIRSDAFQFQMSEIRSIHRKFAVRGQIEPTRITIAEQHLFSIYDVLDALGGNPFVPDGRELLFAEAIMCFLGQDDVAALSLLLPQLENSLRHLAASVDPESCETVDPFTFAGPSLPSLLDPSVDHPARKALTKILPPGYVHEMYLLFSFAGGPAIRNQLAHGRASSNWFSLEDSIYASWLIVHLALFRLIADERKR